MVSSAASAAGVRLDAVQTRADTTRAGSFTPVVVRASAVGDVRGVSRLIATLERGPTLIVLRELSISQSDPAASSERVEALRVELVAEALTLGRVARRTR
jgi:hypothetical protein